MKIEWSEQFKKECAKADKALGEESGCFLEAATNSLEYTAFEEDLDRLDKVGYFCFDFEDWTTYTGPVHLRVETIEIDKSDVLNWHEYYAYRKTMFKLERSA